MPRTPQMLRYGKGGQYVRVKIDGQLIHLGRHGDPESEDKYKQLIARWAVGDSPDDPADDRPTVAVLLASYLDYAQSYYAHDANRLSHVKRLIRTVRELYADLPADEFGPKKLKVVREAFIDQGRVRKKVNEAVRDVIAMFSYGAEQELIEGRQVQSLREVKSLRKGRSRAPESQRVRAVDLGVVDQTCEHLTPVLRDMVQLQLLSGARPGEICNLTPGQIDRSGDVWVYRPDQHKTAHLEHERTICFGPQAQDVLRKYLLRPADAACFSPREALAQHLDEKHANRKTPHSCGNVPDPRKRHQAVAKVGDRYDVCGYRRAIHRACDRAKVERWNPNRLRHTRATQVRASMGLDAAQAMLGHQHASITEVYAEVNLAKVSEIAKRLG